MSAPAMNSMQRTLTALGQRHSDAPRVRHELEQIEQSSRHLLNVINDILDISRIEAERLVLEHLPFKLGQVLEHLMGMVGHRAQEKGLKLLVMLPPQGLSELDLVGDPQRLCPVLINLICNALKFTDAGSITLQARLAEEGTDSALLRWEVIETGIGISADDQAHLFTAFEQADGSLTASTAAPAWAWP